MKSITSIHKELLEFFENDIEINEENIDLDQFAQLENSELLLKNRLFLDDYIFCLLEGEAWNNREKHTQIIKDFISNISTISSLYRNFWTSICEDVLWYLELVSLRDSENIPNIIIGQNHPNIKYKEIIGFFKTELKYFSIVLSVMIADIGILNKSKNLNELYDYYNELKNNYPSNKSSSVVLDIILLFIKRKEYSDIDTTTNEFLFESEKVYDVANKKLLNKDDFKFVHPPFEFILQE